METSNMEFSTCIICNTVVEYEETDNSSAFKTVCNKSSCKNEYNQRRQHILKGLLDDVDIQSIIRG